VVGEKSPPKGDPGPAAGFPPPKTQTVEAVSGITDRAALIDDDGRRDPDTLGLGLVDLERLVRALLNDHVAMRRWTGRPVSGTNRRSLASHHSIADLLPFEFRKSTQHVSLQPSGGTSRIESLSDGHEGHPPVIQVAEGVG